MEYQLNKKLLSPESVRLHTNERTCGVFLTVTEIYRQMNNLIYDTN